MFFLPFLKLLCTRETSLCILCPLSAFSITLCRQIIPLLFFKIFSQIMDSHSKFSLVISCYLMFCLARPVYTVWSNWFLFENRPAINFCNYKFITDHKMYNFWSRIKDTVYFFFIANNNNYDSNIKNILLRNGYKIINLRYPTYMYQFIIFLIITTIEFWFVFKQDPSNFGSLVKSVLPLRH